MNRRYILIAEDQPSAAEYAVLALEERYDDVRTVRDGVEALLAIEKERPGLLLADLRMPRMDGLELLTLVRQRWPDLPVIMVTVEQDVETVVEAVQRGAFNYLIKPVPPARLLAVVEKAFRSVAAGAASDSSTMEIVGESQAIARVRHLVARAARSDVNVLVRGETGTGKELVARAIHRLSSLSGGPFLSYNCAVCPQELLESEFFGHRRGAFTGADRDHSGLLRQSDGGILFLDELECMSMPHQAKLLRVIDDGEVRSVGSTEVHHVSVRFLAASNQDPSALIAAGSLREDLYFRLRGFEIHIPPLREHPEDIPLLAAHFLGGDPGRLTKKALTALGEYPWPGNVRELQNVLRSAQALADDDRIREHHLALEPVSKIAASIRPTPGGSLKDAERQAIIDALRRCQGNRSRAARTLGISRSTLRRKLQEFGLDSQ